MEPSIVFKAGAVLPPPLLSVPCIDIGGVRLLIFGNLFTPLMFGQDADGRWCAFYEWQKLDDAGIKTQ